MNSGPLDLNERVAYKSPHVVFYLTVYFSLKLELGDVIEISSESDARENRPSKWAPPVIIGTLKDIFLTHKISIVLVPLIFGSLAATYALTKEREYTSYAYLRIDEGTARAANAIMGSIPILNMVLSKFDIPGSTADERRRLLDRKRFITVAPNEVPRTSSLFRLSIVDGDPKRAQSINSAFIDAWLKSTEPPPIKRQTLEADISRTERILPEMSSLLDAIKAASPPALSAENTMTDSPTTPALALITKIEQTNQRLDGLKQQTRGVSRDAIFAAPDLPDSTNPTRAALFALIGAVVSEALLVGFFLVKRLAM